MHLRPAVGQLGDVAGLGWALLPGWALAEMTQPVPCGLSAQPRPARACSHGGHREAGKQMWARPFPKLCGHQVYHCPVDQSKSRGHI